MPHCERHSPLGSPADLHSLTLKSKFTPDGKPGHAVLCTQNQTFDVRQLQSSNVIHVVQTTPAIESDDAALTSIAQCGGFLELAPAALDTHAYLAQHLPVYDGSELAEGVKLSKSELCEAAPFSTDEFEQAWQDACACIVHGKQCIPAPNVLQKVWQSLVLASTVDGIDLGATFEVDSLLRSVGDEATPEISRAILQRTGKGTEPETRK